MKKTYQLTPQGRKDLENELEALKQRRGELAERIAEAREHGDLKENAEYDAARTDQGVAETRIAEIENILLNAEDISASTSGTVGLGATVTLKNDKKSVTYTVVGPVEANPLEGKVSNESPIGQALMGRKLGDEVTITTPKASIVYNIDALA